MDLYIDIKQTYRDRETKRQGATSQEKEFSGQFYQML
jgi:hypothetical protein